MKDDTSLILTIDFGTQSVRVSLFDALGNAIASEKEIYQPAYFSLKPGWAEQDPDYYFTCMTSACRRLSEKNKDSLSHIIGIVQTCFRDSAVLLDKDGKPVRPMILWLDQRSAKCEEKLPLLSRLAFSLVGKEETIQLNRKRTVANWVKENEPENWEKTAKYVAVSTYFIYRLSGELKDCASDFTGHYPIDYPKKTWYKDPMKNMQGQIFSIRKDQLCTIVPSLSKLGSLREETAKELGLPAGLPIYAAGSDKSCETLGTGVVDSSLASISLGTACTLETVTKHYRSPYPFLPAYSSVLPDCYNLDLQIYRGYWMINWFLKEFGATRVNDLVTDDLSVNEFNEHLKEVPPGSDGLMVQPYWGSQLEKPEVRGTITGFSDITTREHVYRAIIEGVSYELRSAEERFEKILKTHFGEIRISGGGSVSDEICQITADVFNKPVSRVQTNETSSLGAAIAGFLGSGVYPNAKEAVGKMVRVSRTFQPDPKNAEIYEKLYRKVYVKLYPDLKQELKTLYHFSLRS